MPHSDTEMQDQIAAGRAALSEALTWAQDNACHAVMSGAHETAEEDCRIAARLQRVLGALDSIDEIYKAEGRV